MNYETPSQPLAVWPWFVGGALSPIVGQLLTGPLPRYAAAGLAFFVFFAAANFLVIRTTPSIRRPLLRSVLAGAAGGAIVAMLTSLTTCTDASGTAARRPVRLQQAKARSTIDRTRA